MDGGRKLKAWLKEEEKASEAQTNMQWAIPASSLPQQVLDLSFMIPLLVNKINSIESMLTLVSNLLIKQGVTHVNNRS